MRKGPQRACILLFGIFPRCQRASQGDVSIRHVWSLYATNQLTSKHNLIAISKRSLDCIDAPVYRCIETPFSSRLLYLYFSALLDRLFSSLNLD